MEIIRNISAICLITATTIAAVATESADSITYKTKQQRLSLGGYGEAVMTRNFYSDAWTLFAPGASQRRPKPRTI